MKHHGDWSACCKVSGWLYGLDWISRDGSRYRAPCSTDEYQNYMILFWCKFTVQTLNVIRHIGSSPTYWFGKCQKWQIGWQSKPRKLQELDESKDAFQLLRQNIESLEWSGWGGAEVGGKWVFTQRDETETHPFSYFHTDQTPFFKCLIQHSSNGSGFW